jgi:hypothetical protein
MTGLDDRMARMVRESDDTNVRQVARCVVDAPVRGACGPCANGGHSPAVLDPAADPRGQRNGDAQVHFPMRPALDRLRVERDGGRNRQISDAPPFPVPLRRVAFGVRGGGEARVIMWVREAWEVRKVRKVRIVRKTQRGHAQHGSRRSRCRDRCMHRAHFWEALSDPVLESVGVGVGGRNKEKEETETKKKMFFFFLLGSKKVKINQRQKSKENKKNKKTKKTKQKTKQKRKKEKNEKTKRKNEKKWKGMGTMTKTGPMWRC